MGSEQSTRSTTVKGLSTSEPIGSEKPEAADALALSPYTIPGSQSAALSRPIISTSDQRAAR